MGNAPQFWLTFLSFETFLIALAFGMTRLIEPHDGPFQALLRIAITGSYGLALWQLLRKLNFGVIETSVLMLLAFVLYSLLSPVAIR